MARSRVCGGRFWAVGGFALALAGCAEDGDERTMASSAPDTVTLGQVGGDDSGGAEDDDDDDDGGDGEKFDVGSGNTDGPLPCNEGGDCETECEAKEHTPCDDGTTDLFAAMGLGCPGDAEVSVSVDGTLAAMGVRTGFGSTGEWAPREGTAYAVLGSGFVSDLDMPTPALDNDDSPTHCNDDLGEEYDKGAALPAPLRVTDVIGDCASDPTVLGSGDCSNTIQTQFDKGGAANDYTELRIEATVPGGANSLSYDFAFFSTEYPEYYGSGFNDMFIGWLESEAWTGNVSFDVEGNPISLNAGFLDFRDDSGATPELAGTCMQRHAGTRWLSTTAPVSPGEDITVVLAVFDLADSILDSYVFLDNFNWGCDPTGMPQTEPVG
ncbi:MAG: choice-of-anchor L domain-containing protein [Myxococcota bacterium]